MQFVDVVQLLELTELFYNCLLFFVQMLNLPYMFPPEGTQSRDAYLRSLPTVR